MKRARLTICLAVVCVMAAVNFASADTIRGISMDFVNIGNAGNSTDPATGNLYGAVSSNYRIGKYEVTNAQWNAFVTVAGAPTGNPIVAYDQGAYYIGTQQPTNYVSWYEAAQFCNYLTSGNKYSGAYKFDISGNFQEIDRVASISTYGTTYVIPTKDEWYKAAYFKPNASGYSLYANGTDIAPVAGVNSNYDWVIGSPWNITNGTPEQNGTFDMMGNVWEWNETLIVGSFRGVCGGAFDDYVYDLSSSIRHYYYPIDENYYIGFRVASVPEPCSLALLFIGGLVLRNRKR
jgi:sulfatase modifying factor 1